MSPDTCARALGFDLLDVRRLERIVVLALEQEGRPTPPVEERVRTVPAGRFARPGAAFDHRFTDTADGQRQVELPTTTTSVADAVAVDAEVVP